MDAIADTASARTAAAPLAAIARAAQATGERFDFLLAKARLESGLVPSARARTSSASGLFQFVERTWLATVKRHGARHGLGWAAEAIDWAGGRLSVASAELRAAILKLRDDPEAAAAMAAEHAAENRARLEARLGRAVGDTELYLAHFLGAGGATRFLRALATDPDAPAAALLPRAARANRAIFFDRAGEPRSLASIFERFAARLERAGASAAAAPVAPATLPAQPPAAATLLALRAPPSASQGSATAKARPAIDPALAAQSAYLLLARLG
jgi:hypothetical protein